MTARDQAANAMMGAFDFSQSPRAPLILEHTACKVAFNYTNPNYDD